LFFSIILNLDSPPIFVSTIALSLVFLITGIFDLKGYYNKTLYLTIIAIIAVTTGILSFQLVPLYPNMDKTVDSIFIVIFILLYIGFGIFKIKEWSKFQKTLEYYDKLLAINPNDITALNNKGVELTSQRRYEKAIECFDKVLELDPEDSAALHNQNFLEKYGKNRTVSDKLEKGPELEITDKAGKLFLEIKRTKRKRRKTK
jgi:tetratricopeptide (TPR) repeat protein